MCLFPVHFIASCLWAPPVATQFSVCGHRQWRPLPVLFISSHHFSGHQLWRLSFLFCHRLLWKLGHRQCRPFCSIWFHGIVSLCTACGDSVFCCFGTASDDPCHFFAAQHFCGHRLWRLSFLFCHTVFCTYTHTHSFETQLTLNSHTLSLSVSKSQANSLKLPLSLPPSFPMRAHTPALIEHSVLQTKSKHTLPHWCNTNVGRYGCNVNLSSFLA